MQIYILLALLPCMWAADLSNITCPDGSICPFGEACHSTSSDYEYECGVLPESERDNTKLVLAVIQSYGQSISYASCPGTLCLKDWCCLYDKATCCANSTSCCPGDTKCCGDNYPHQWCCKTKQRCAESYMYCIAGATAISPAFAALLVIFLGFVISKQF